MLSSLSPTHAPCMDDAQLDELITSLASSSSTSKAARPSHSRQANKQPREVHLQFYMILALALVAFEALWL